MEQFNIVLNQLINFMILMMIGYLSVKLKIVNEKFLDTLSKLIMTVLLPLLIFSNAVSGTTRKQLIDCYPIMILTFFMYVGLIGVFFIVGKLLNLRGERNKIFRAALIFGNAGFIGIPLLTTIFDERGAIYVALMSLVDQFFLWSYGVKLTTPSVQKQPFNIKKLLNPALCAVVAAIILIVLNIHLPEVVINSFSTMGKASTPLSLFYLGGLFLFSNWKPVLKEKELYIGIILKMIAFPLLFFFIASHLCKELEMVKALTLISGLPTMTTIAMFTKSKGNEADYAVGFVLITTVASLITLTIVSYCIF